MMSAHVSVKVMTKKPVVLPSVSDVPGQCTTMLANMHAVKSQGNSSFQMSRR